MLSPGGTTEPMFVGAGLKPALGRIFQDRAGLKPAPTLSSLTGLSGYCLIGRRRRIAVLLSERPSGTPAAPMSKTHKVWETTADPLRSKRNNAFRNGRRTPLCVV